MLIAEPPLRRRRFAYGYALDGSEFPCYPVWPQRDGRSYVLLDTATADTLVLDNKSFFRPLGMHFFELMPCTLEARTVIKTPCGRSAILTLFENR